MPPYIYARTLSLFSLIVVQNQTFSRDSLKVTSKLIIALYLNKINCSIECVKSKEMYSFIKFFGVETFGSRYKLYVSKAIGLLYVFVEYHFSSRKF